MAIGFKGGYTRKKEGSSVYFVNQNVKGKVKQVSRAYVSDIKNPKTLGQAKQRALFVAAKNFRRGFEGLLNHSWQGTKYGSPSLAKFMSLVMANKGTAYPDFFYQPRNSMKFIPQPWPLSTGSVAAEVLISDELNLRNGQASTNLKVVTKLAEGANEGDFYKALLEANPQLADGDMLTFCAVVTDSFGVDMNGTEKYAAVFDRMIINTSSTAEFNRNPVTQNGIFTIDQSPEGYRLSAAKAPYTQIAGFGVIVSRRNSVGTAYQRNNAVMALASQVTEYYSSDAYKENCLRSLMDDSFLESTWYLNQVGYDQSAQGGNNIGNGDDDTTVENP